MIYCVEDDGSIRDLMVYALQAAGFSAGFGQDAADAHADAFLRVSQGEDGKACLSPA